MSAIVLCTSAKIRTIRGDVDNGLDVLTSTDEGSGNDGVVGLAADTDGTE